MESGSLVPLLVGKLGVGHALDQGPVAADGTALEALVPEADSLEGYQRDPNGGEEVPLRASHHHIVGAAAGRLLLRDEGRLLLLVDQGLCLCL